MEPTTKLLLQISAVIFASMLALLFSYHFGWLGFEKIAPEQESESSEEQSSEDEREDDEKDEDETSKESSSAIEKIDADKDTLSTLHRALKYKDEQIRHARRHIDLSPPGPLLAAQIHVESHWREEARSGVGAQGLAQVMPDTAEHISELDGDLSKEQILNSPAGSLRAQSVYMGYLLKHIEKRQPADETTRYAFVLSSYNGGLGWLDRERKLADDPHRWFDAVAEERARSQSAWEENRHYVRGIFSRQEYYDKLGWPGDVIDHPG